MNDPRYDPAVAVLLTLYLVAGLALRYAISDDAKARTFSLRRRETTTCCAAAMASCGLILWYLVEKLRPMTGPVDMLHISASVAYLVVGGVSAVMMILAAGRRGMCVLSVTLTVNTVAAAGYVARIYYDAPDRFDAFGVRISEFRYVTWFHTMGLMCLLIAHAASCTNKEALDMLTLAGFTIYLSWVGSDAAFLAEGDFPRPVAAVFFAASSLALWLLTRTIHEKIATQCAVEVPPSLAAVIDGNETGVRRLSLMIVATWWGFPVVHGFVAAGLASDWAGECTTAALEVLAKSLCTLVMMHGRIETLEERERRARSLENWRLSEQLRAETMFVSYVFHEMRNPSARRRRRLPAVSAESCGGGRRASSSGGGRLG